MRFGHISTLFLLLSLFVWQLLAESPVSRANNELRPEDFVFLVAGGSRFGAVESLSRHMVSLRARTASRFFGDNHFCAGIIVGERWILTAAHCVMNFRKIRMRPRAIIVVTGTRNRIKQEPTSRLWAVKSVTTHPNFTLRNTNDIALIYLKRKIKMNERTEVVPLPTQPPPFGSRCIVLGWGRLFKDGPLAARITHVELILFPQERCRNLSSRFAEDALCAGDDYYVDADACRGDSGGPLFCNDKLVAVVSWTIGCGSRKMPSIYTDIYHNLRWIKRTIGSGARRQIAPGGLGALVLTLLLKIWMKQCWRCGRTA